LTSKGGQNVHDAGLVDVSSNSVFCSDYPKRAADLQNPQSDFQSNDQPNSWICYDFKSSAVAPTHYLILSAPWGPNQDHHLKSWCLEVSTDDKSWTELHRCDCNNDLNGLNQIGTYSVDRELTCRFVRLRQTGKNHGNGDYFLLSGFEIFGILSEG
jgi:hypothetical protein